MNRLFKKSVPLFKEKGFTLAELLSALAILGVIATFTIPKVLNASQNGQKVAIAKEIASSISGAYTAYSLNNSPTSSTGIFDLTPYMNYVRIDSSTVIDERPSLTSENCATANRVCLQMHNGATVMYFTNVSFSGTGALNAVWFLVDPDSSYSGSTTGSGKGTKFWLYYNGRLTSQSGVATGTTYSLGVTAPAADADWFSW